MPQLRQVDKRDSQTSNNITSDDIHSTTTSAVRASRVKHDALVDKPARGSSARCVRQLRNNDYYPCIPRCMYISWRSYRIANKTGAGATVAFRALHIVTAAINNHYIRRAVLPNTEVLAACNLSTCKPRRMGQQK